MLGYWGLSSILYLICIFLLWFEVWRGTTPAFQAWWLTGFSLGGELGFLFMICMSARWRLQHGQIANIQGYHAIIAIVGAYACVTPVRGGTLLLLMGVLVFCSFTLKKTRSRRLGVFTIALLGTTMLWLVMVDPVRHHVADEAIYFILATSMLVAVTSVTSQFDYLRRRLQAERVELNDALERIRLLATRDELTSLPNRRHMNHVIMDEEGSAQGGARDICVALLDLDHFKQINDRHGHAVGDDVLRQFASSLQPLLRASDVLARWGGEEFLILLPDTGQEDAERIMQRIQQRVLAIPVDGQSAALTVTFSAGLACVQPGERIVDAIHRADKAMFEAKAAGRNTYRFFDPAVEALATARERFNADLAHAISADQLRLHYQPQVHTDGSILGAEALVRWLHPEQGLIPPGDFIPLAESTGLIEPLGHWVVAAACKQLRTWSQAPLTRGLTLSVNVSARQLRAPDFVERVLSAIRATGVDARLLKLELTESTLIANLDDTILKMAALKEAGVGFSLDDFGTGYSSLAYLKRLPLTQLKIDQSFVRDMLADTHDTAIISTIIALARSLGLTVIAEGVETTEQRDLINALGCDNFQGFLYSKPLNTVDFDAFTAKPRAVAFADDSISEGCVVVESLA